MAYLRAYMAGMGDPGFGSWLKKRLKITPKSFQPGNIIKQIGKAAALAPIPGVGLIGKAAGAILPRAAQIGRVLGPIVGAGAASGIAGSAAERLFGSTPGPSPAEEFSVPLPVGPGGMMINVGVPGARGRAGFGRRGRRMNVANVRALRRSIRRVRGFAHLAKSTLQLTRTVKLKKRGRGRS